MSLGGGRVRQYTRCKIVLHSDQGKAAVQPLLRPLLLSSRRLAGYFYKALGRLGLIDQIKNQTAVETCQSYKKLQLKQIDK